MLDLDAMLGTIRTEQQREEFADLIVQTSETALRAGILNHRSGNHAVFEIVAFAHRMIMLQMELDKMDQKPRKREPLGLR